MTLQGLLPQNTFNADRQLTMKLKPLTPQQVWIDANDTTKGLKANHESIHISTKPSCPECKLKLSDDKLMINVRGNKVDILVQLLAQLFGTAQQVLCHVHCCCVFLRTLQMGTP
jgi:hypothetical protein